MTDSYPHSHPNLHDNCVSRAIHNDLKQSYRSLEARAEKAQAHYSEGLDLYMRDVDSLRDTATALLKRNQRLEAYITNLALRGTDGMSLPGEEEVK